MNEQQTPVTIRPAATIILAREQCGTVEIYLLERSAQSGFMGGFYVFPGSVVEDEDRGMNAWQSHVDLPADQITARLGSPSLNLEYTLGFSIAAIRETLEEAGVQVADAADKTAMDYEQMAAAVWSRTGLPTGLGRKSCKKTGHYLCQAWAGGPTGSRPN